MENLKINVTLGSFKVELEGESSTVIAQFNEIKEKGLGQLVDQLTPLVTQNRPEIIEAGVTKTLPAETTGLPLTGNGKMSLKELVLKSLPASEPEWIVIYGSYTMDSGNENFTKEDIIGKYKESNRWGTTNRKNLSNSLKSSVVKGWVRAINDTDFIVTEGGINQVNEILARTKGVVKIHRKKKDKTVNKDESNTM